MVTDSTSQLSGLFGVYLQASDLDRSLSFYRDVPALEVVWNDGALAVLHSQRAPPGSAGSAAHGQDPQARPVLFDYLMQTRAIRSAIGAWAKRQEP